MKKNEFLREIENNLEGRVSYLKIKKILNEYEEKFTSGYEEDKDDEIISSELGSPSKIARRILEDNVMDSMSSVKKVGNEIEKKFENGADKLYEKIVSVDQRIDTNNLATMGKRTGAYFMDSILLGIVGMVIVWVISQAFEGASYYNTNNFFTSLFVGFTPFILLLGLFNILGGLIVWLTNGYTPGKWMVSIRIVKIDGSKITFIDALMRELLIKSILNALVMGILNIASFIWACSSEDNKTVHDVCVKTRVVTTIRLEGKSLGEK